MQKSGTCLLFQALVITVALDKDALSKFTQHLGNRASLDLLSAFTRAAEQSRKSVVSGIVGKE